jgi:purine nucleosidase
MLRPDRFSGRQINVTIETSSELTLGMTVADWWGITDRPKNAYFVRDGDPEGFYALLNKCRGRLP